jgi:curved DNA-binding protein CbpA
MYLKDYFTILQLEPSASLAEIKAAYRRLAQQYHPDKTSNDPYATALFNDIKEAYENLSSPWKKEMYLQQRWYVQSTGSKRRSVTTDPVNLLKQSLELEKYVAELDVHRMDKNGLFEYIAELINDDTLDKLQAFDEPAIKEEITGQLIKCCTVLGPVQFDLLSTRLLKLSDSELTVSRIAALRQQLGKKKHGVANSPSLFC